MFERSDSRRHESAGSENCYLGWGSVSAGVGESSGEPHKSRERQKRENHSRASAHHSQLPGYLCCWRPRSCSASEWKVIARSGASCDATRNVCCEGDFEATRGKTEAEGLQVFR